MIIGVTVNIDIDLDKIEDWEGTEEETKTIEARHIARQLKAVIEAVLAMQPHEYERIWASVDGKIS